MQKTPEFRATSVAVSRCIAGMVDYPVWSRLGEINSPTLILYGTDDKMIPNPVFTGGSTRSIGEAGQRAIPNSELVMIPGGGHTVHHDFPAEFNKAVYAFLARI
jgi:pimeloyl-ACP methyl ester carboxylesterase